MKKLIIYSLFLMSIYFDSGITIAQTARDNFDNRIRQINIERYRQAVLSICNEKADFYQTCYGIGRDECSSVVVDISLACLESPTDYTIKYPDNYITLGVNGLPQAFHCVEVKLLNHALDNEHLFAPENCEY